MAWVLVLLIILSGEWFRGNTTLPDNVVYTFWWYSQKVPLVMLWSGCLEVPSCVRYCSRGLFVWDAWLAHLNQSYTNIGYSRAPGCCGSVLDLQLGFRSLCRCSDGPCYVLATPRCDLWVNFLPPGVWRNDVWPFQIVTKDDIVTYLTQQRRLSAVFLSWMSGFVVHYHCVLQQCLQSTKFSRPGSFGHYMIPNDRSSLRCYPRWNSRKVYSDGRIKVLL